MAASPKTKKTITILVPTFNEEDNVERCYRRVSDVIAPFEASYEFELLFVDNHSTDGTFEILKGFAAQDKRLRAIRYSKNFGFQRSVFTGYTMARGDALIQIDADLQDPPEIIAEFIKKWEAGYKVVYGIRRNRKEGKVINFLRAAFYFIIDALAECDLPHHAGDFRLVDRVLIDQIAAKGDCHPYIRGMLAEMGYTQIGVPFDRQAREFGESKFKIRQYFSFAFDGILFHSVLPLRAATYFGLLIAGGTVVLILFYLLNHFLSDDTQPAGFATTTVLILFGISLNAIFLGIIGEYLARIYQQLKKTPQALIEETVNDDPRK
ncbi:glycosyltransferase family 2 protein [Rhodospirillaceae bacterium KN72]|uniref:Glycosyltransferase family 2 protein n=1 Tax=Pacificispira spongiicola TaxID=2729598 RepID=A0A7Y0DWI9_9PROT|nr:glycosyltransferase family 2 protein [Pacificispira spongiicola]NMM42904.1 glycosyltransferase family 2 protein [Pacificispira spongiicola]